MFNFEVQYEMKQIYILKTSSQLYTALCYLQHPACFFSPFFSTGWGKRLFSIFFKYFVFPVIEV